MALPLLALLGIGGALTGGASYLFGQENKRQAQGQLGALESALASSPWAGTPQGMSLLQNAQEDMQTATWRDWATGAPNAELGQMRDWLTMRQFDRASQLHAAGVARQNQLQDMALEKGLAQERQLQVDWAKESAPLRGVQGAYYDLVDAVESGTSMAGKAAIQKMGQLLEMGLITDQEGKTLSQSGGYGNVFATAINEITAGGAMTEATKAQLLDTANFLAENNQTKIDQLKSGFDTRLSRLQQRYGDALQIQDPYTYGTMFGDAFQISPLTPKQQQALIQSQRPIAETPVDTAADAQAEIELLRRENELLKSGEYRMIDGVPVPYSPGPFGR